jgi:hypothetical protein
LLLWAADYSKHYYQTNQSPSFQNYGTAMLRYEDTEIEFVGARKESYHLKVEIL